MAVFQTPLKKDKPIPLTLASIKLGVLKLQMYKINNCIASQCYNITESL